MNEPRQNEIRRGKDIGPSYSPTSYFVYVACPDCGTRRWSACKKDNLLGAGQKPCPSCRNKRNAKARKGKYHAPNRLNLVGQRFGRLLVLDDAGTRRKSSNRAESLWLCQCDCGNKKVITGTNLRTGDATSCGCYNIERIVETKTINPVDYKINRIMGIYQRGARARNLPFDLGRDDILELIEANCHYCGAKPSNVARPHGKDIPYQGIDRKDNSLGYFRENCVPCCWKCNCMKKTMNHNEYIEHCRLVADRFAISLEFSNAAGI